MELVTTDGNNLKVYFPPCLISIRQHVSVHGFQGSISPLQTHNLPICISNYISFLNSSTLSLQTANATTGNTLQNASGFHLPTPLSPPALHASSHTMKLLLLRLPALHTCSPYKGFMAPHIGSLFQMQRILGFVQVFSLSPSVQSCGCSGCGPKKTKHGITFA